MTRGIGDNQPPSALDDQQSAVNALIEEAEATLTGVPVENEQQDLIVGNLLGDLKRLKTSVTKAHKLDKEPWLEGGRGVDNTKNNIITQLETAIADAQKLRGPWLVAKEKEREDAARIAREEAEAKQKELQEAHQTKRETYGGDFEESVKINQAEEDAKTAKKAASKANKKVATGLKTIYNTSLIDLSKAVNSYYMDPRLHKALLDMAKSDVHSGKREIPGFEIKEERVAR